MIINWEDYIKIILDSAKKSNQVKLKEYWCKYVSKEDEELRLEDLYCIPIKDEIAKIHFVNDWELRETKV